MKAIKALASKGKKHHLKITPLDKECTSLDLSSCKAHYYVRTIIIRDDSGIVLYQESRPLSSLQEWIILINNGACYLEADDGGKLIVEEGKRGSKIFFVLFGP